MPLAARRVVHQQMPGAVGMSTACFRARDDYGIQQLDPLRAAAPACGPPVARQLAAGTTGKRSAWRPHAASSELLPRGQAVRQSFAARKVVPGHELWWLWPGMVQFQGWPLARLSIMGPSLSGPCCQVTK